MCCNCSGSKRGGEGGLGCLSSLPSHPASLTSPVSICGSSSMMHVIAQGSKESLAQGSEESLPWGVVSELKRQVGGSQLSGTVNIFFSEKSDGSSMLKSSSTIVPGGEPTAIVACRHRCLAKVTARLKSRCRFLLEAAAYQPALLRGRPLNLGMIGVKFKAKSPRAR
jgi:hypothetical protein